MALDLASIRKKLNQIQSGGKGPFWKPKEGETIIRIVPLQSDPTNPFQELFFHYLGDRKTFLSPHTFGNPDPFMEASEALISEGGLSKEDYKEAKKLCPVPRTYVPIVVRGEEKQGVKFWAFGSQVYEKLLIAMQDEDFGDITDVKEGHDIKVSFTPAKDKTFAKTELTIRPKKTSLTDDSELLNKLLKQQPILLDEFTVASYDELKAILDATFAGGTEEAAPAKPAAPAKAAKAESDDDGWGETAKPDASAGTVRAGKAPKATPAVEADDEFSDLFDK